MAKQIIFMLIGDDMSLVASAPEDITLKQLLKQCDKLRFDWGACGICSIREDSPYKRRIDIEIGYDSIKQTREDDWFKINESE